MELAHGVIGSSANLTCAAHSQPPPVFEWFREMVLLGNSKLYRIINQKWKSILQVKIKDASVFGDYHCVVSNTMGKVKRKITLVEGIAKSPPAGVVRKLGDDVPAQVSSSSPNLGSKLRGLSKNSSLVASKRVFNISKLKQSKPSFSHFSHILV
ncbi:hypothetical protein AVEN_100527-1 [Araneus ventricosus]|uniref:Ig-like domain-containing protein n=1 Tax=Araneus ventricosus TaxID=182803 RepID=A0A4Y2JWW6_ARAVE|nr:hypothetical protein AVEN_100527-1 [Araneus ventricosus]